MRTRTKPKIFRPHFDRTNLEERQPLIADRDYGFMRSSHTSTPFPKKQNPLDVESLRARLEAQGESQMKIVPSNSITSDVTEDFDFPEEESQPFLSFSMRRKIFDTGEYTICKGRKMSETFHQGYTSCQNEPYRDGMGCRHRLSSYAVTYHSYKELQDYCVKQNIKFTG
ncbi:uncharacterized protein Dana_GF18394 [Drosophila ananassae]|uniref:Uncharacterized protein n=1 Tax=Drosophila ananassae TaxID=7217 RepID=B3M117_DROAN|nr:uncharacterized protein LOC6501169 [Drosophila ananassae]EDV43246.1 uncharacterized protein Dana_GF18394 [Drosophila ananassae]